MFRQSTILMSVLAASAALFAASPSTSAQDQVQWTSLLNPDNLDNWDQTGDANWEMVDGIAQADAGFGHLVAKESYGDFVLRVEFWVDDPANSGVFLRCSDPSEPSPRSCYEVNIFDERPDPSFGTGGIPRHAAIAGMPKISGQWNVYEITAQGDHIVVVLNGRRTVDIRDDTYASGPVTLQYGAGVVKFRRVDIRPL
ncbi:MAG: DUF1080 domain-containing protein [Micropepsaceae bacterium]